MIKKTKSEVPEVQRQKANLPAVNLSQQMLTDAHGNSGFENMRPDDIAIPFITILQALSPQLRGTTKIKGAEEGDFFNTVTSEIYKGVIKVIPCAYHKSYVEWVPRDSGGGFVRQHDESILEKCTRNDKNQDILPGGNIIVTTGYHYCILLNGKKQERVVLAFSSTQLKKSRRWNSQMMALQISSGSRVITPPMFSHIYTCETVEESNDHGSWAGWQISSPEMIDDSILYSFAKKFNGDVTKGSVKVSPPPDLTESAGQPSESTAGMANAESDVF